MQDFVGKIKEMHITYNTLALFDRTDALRNCMNEERFAQQKVYAHSRGDGGSAQMLCEATGLYNTLLSAQARYCVAATTIITLEQRAAILPAMRVDVLTQCCLVRMLSPAM
jgi:hypothetical protein